MTLEPAACPHWNRRYGRSCVLSAAQGCSTQPRPDVVATRIERLIATARHDR